MDKKSRNVLLLTILSVLITSGVFTYAYIRKPVTQTVSNTINTLTCLDLTLESKDKEGNITEGISLSGAYPITDAEGLQGNNYSFTVTNNCDTPIVVDIGMQTIGTGLDPKYVKYAVDDGTNKPGMFTIGWQTTKTVKVNNADVTINVLDKVFLDANTAEDQDTTTVEVDNDTPSEGARKTYNLRLWINEATTWEQAHDKNNNILNYTGKIVAVASPTKGRYTPEFAAEEGTLLAAIKNGNYEFLNSLTSPGKEINTYSEHLIAKTEDDYGTSYYFRGNVNNNYVLFAEKCWRIVRIDGLGNTKLFLWNNANNCTGNSAPANRTFNAGTIKYTKIDGVSKGNLYQTASGVGFMYGKPDSIILYTTNNTGAQDNISKSSILEYLETWYGTNINKVVEENSTEKYSDYLADVIWCGDKSRSSGPGYGQSGEARSNFSSYGRLSTLSSANPTLICPDEGLEGSPTISKYTVEATEENKGNGDLDYPIGLITIDEAAFAGGAYNFSNNSYYLATGSLYWTMSPSIFNGSTANVWGVRDSASFSYGYHVNDGSGGVRPAVSLKGAAMVESGDGTISTPYVINGMKA